MITVDEELWQKTIPTSPGKYLMRLDEGGPLAMWPVYSVKINKKGRIIFLKKDITEIIAQMFKGDVDVHFLDEKAVQNADAK